MSLLDIPLDRVLDEIEYVPAKWIREPSESDRIFIVTHCMGTPQTPRGGGRARNNAAYFAGGSGGRKASTHFGVDNVEGIRSVPDESGCYGAAGTNWNGIHVEFSGNESLTPDEWLSEDYGLPCIKEGAWLYAAISLRFGIPLTYVGVDGLHTSTPGVVTHNDCSEAFEPGGHSDPGPNFPMDVLIHTAQAFLDAFLNQEDTMTPEQMAEIKAHVDAGMGAMEARIMAQFRKVLTTGLIVTDDGEVLEVKDFRAVHVEKPEHVPAILERGSRWLGNKWPKRVTDLLQRTGPTDTVQSTVDEISRIVGHDPEDDE